METLNLSKREFDLIKQGKQCYSGPLSANLKCVVISLILAGAYWFLPKKNKWVLLGILYFTYLFIAWYDHIYKAERAFGPTYLKHFYHFLKPQDSVQNILYKNMCPENDKKIILVDIVVLLVIICLAKPFLDWKP